MSYDNSDLLRTYQAEVDALKAALAKERAEHINDVAIGERRLIASEAALSAALLRAEQAEKEVVRLTREREDYREKRAAETENLTARAEVLADALRLYEHCRHGESDCFCVREARALAPASPPGDKL